MITELLARSLSIQELADRLSDHPDVAVRILAQRVIDASIEESNEDDDD